MKYVKSTLVLLLLFSFSLVAQAQKRALTHEDFDTWKRIRGEKISPNGEYVAYHLAPGKGNQTLQIKSHSGELLGTFNRGENSSFTYDSRYLVFNLVPDMEELNDLKRKKTKEKDLPKDTLAIFNLQNKSLEKIARVKSFKVPEKWNNYVFYTLEEKLEVKDTTKTDSVENKKPKSKQKKVGKDNGYHLIVYNLSTQTRDTIQYVTDYIIAKEGNKLLYHTSGKDSTIHEGVYFKDLSSQNEVPLCRAKGKYKSLTLDKSGSQISFLSDLDTTKALIRNYELRYWKPGQDSARMIADKNADFLPENWVVSEHGQLSFSDNQQTLFFGTAPQPAVQDTTLLPEEIVQVEIWNYQNGRLHTQQNAELEEDQKKYYLAAYYPANNKFVQLGDEHVAEIRTANKGNATHSLGLDYAPYNKYISWEGFPRRMDVYAVNNITGVKKLVMKDLRGQADISSDGNYLLFYNAADTSYSSYSFSDEKVYPLTEKIPTSLANELNDQPNYPWSYGTAGWTTNDEHLLIYDRYDIWQIDPKNQKNPVNLTNGRKSTTEYRYYHLDREEESIDPNQLFLHIFNEKTKAEGYATLSLKKGKVNQLVYEDFSFSRPLKAEKNEKIVYTKESFQRFPDLLASDLSLKKSTKISDANPEISNYKWGTVELYKWTSIDGIPLEGLLYKPENFDPNKQYPMITYFYERNSDNLNRHWGAVPIRSIINPAFYVSRGYIVFIPDIVYKEGYPGESCLNAVVPGVTSLIKEGYVDRDHIGAQGHSWGGYQVAYLVTKTNIFAAAESGAPVANMISAYGGIRWWTGLSRMFQYEHTQSRIGGTLWEYPVRYIENSPIFFVDKVQTPLLIMHNDKDGHVPWYQGIELYVALRRLGKPAWMLNYNEEPHWPTKWENIRDFNVRMQQFFDHYLKEEPAPLWMKEGIPAIEKGINKGYELMKE